MFWMKRDLHDFIKDFPNLRETPEARYSYAEMILILGELTWKDMDTMLSIICPFGIWTRTKADATLQWPHDMPDRKIDGGLHPNLRGID